jgi:flagellar basal-body rod protein FlgB
LKGEPVSSSLLGTTTELVKFALDAASLNQQTIAQNIATASSPGFVPYEIHFDSQMDDLRAKLRIGQEITSTELNAAKPQIVPMTNESGLSPKVAIDMEAAKLAQNVLQYQAVAKAYTQMTTLLSIAINEGKR